MVWYVLGSIGQWLACVLLAGGIGVEIYYRSHVGYLAITLGSVLFALATKLKTGGKDAAIKALVEKMDREAKRHKSS